MAFDDRQAPVHNSGSKKFLFKLGERAPGVVVAFSNFSSKDSLNR